MSIAKHVWLGLCGVTCSVTGFFSILTCVVIMLRVHGEIDEEFGVFVLVRLFVVTELLMAFGVASLLVGLRFLFNRHQLFVRAVDKSWKRAMTYGMISPFLGMALGLLGMVIDYLRS